MYINKLLVLDIHFECIVVFSNVVYCYIVLVNYDGVIAC